MPPSLDRLRRDAKALHRAHAAGMSDARDRLRAHPPRPEGTGLRHADYLHVIAQEQGFESWPRLVFAAETIGLDRAGRQQALKRALFHGRNWQVDRLLAETPDLAAGLFGLEVALLDRAAVERRLAQDPAAATREAGPRRPILHLAFSRRIQAAPERRADMLAIAGLLLRHGADVNDAMPAAPGSTGRLSALYGALGHAGNLPLAEWLLAQGADPNDGESLYHATELGHHDGLKLLMRHGVRVAGTNALARMLDFDDLEGARLLLDYGADPGEGLPALHHAARRMRDGRFARLLIAHGADPARRWQGHSAYGLARIFGNAAFSEALAAAGHATPLDASETALAACAGGAPGASLASLPLGPEDRLLIARLIQFPGRLAHAKALAAAGLDPNAADETGLTPLQLAGWSGLPAAVDWLLACGPDLLHRNAYGGGIVETILHGAENAPRPEGADHAACLRAVLAAGAPVAPGLAQAATDPELADLLDARRPAGLSSPR